MHESTESRTLESLTWTTERSQVDDPLREAYEAHFAPLLRLTALLVDDGSAEDLAQEAFVRAADALRSSRPPASASAYLRRTALNIWKNRLRREAVEKRLRPARRPPEVPVNVNSDTRLVVWAAVQSLPARQRACLILRFYEDLPIPDIAFALGCSIGTVKSQTSKAIARLRRVLSDEP